jgi:hypothetical protein
MFSVFWIVSLTVMLRSEAKLGLKACVHRVPQRTAKALERFAELHRGWSFWSWENQTTWWYHTKHVSVYRWCVHTSSYIIIMCINIYIYNYIYIYLLIFNYIFRIYIPNSYRCPFWYCSALRLDVVRPPVQCPGPEVGPLQQHALKSRGGSETAVRGCHESNDQVSHT